MENHEHDLKNWSIVEKETRTNSATICATRQRQFVRCVNTASNPDATQSDRIAAKTPAAEQQELFVRNDRGRLEPDGKTRFAERSQCLFCTIPARCNTCESLAGRGNHRGDHLGDLYAESVQTLQSSFSAVSTPQTARVSAFFSIFGDLQDSHSFAPLQSQFFSKKAASKFWRMKNEISFAE